MAALILKNISKLYNGEVVGVRDLNVEVSEGELMVLVGPSGSGKSTTLRLVAGLEKPTGGEVHIGGKLANDLPPRDRDIAMVFQDYALYPHLSVEQNLGFGLKMRRAPSGEIRSRVAEVSEMLGIGELLHRKPKELSGGQRQRVALGRALVRNPKVFLFDEPLSNLDAALRVQLRREIKEIHRKLGATMIYVTHDQTEAMALGSRIVVMNEGAVEQIGSPIEIYQRPESRFVAGFFGSPSMNLTECSVTIESGFMTIRFGETGFAFTHEASGELKGVGSSVVIGFRPEAVSLNEPGSDLPSGSDSGSLKGRARIASVEAMGPETLVYMEAGALRPVARVFGHVDLEAGGEVEFTVPRERLHFFDAETGRRLQAG
jgi:multiple sugar transport system ATP-binding protein